LTRAIIRAKNKINSIIPPTTYRRTAR
jgi:hypothetical protein